MEQKKLFNILSLVCNLFLFISITWSVVFYFYHEDGSGNMLAHGFTCFRFFTIDSNVLAGIASGIYLYFNIMRLTGKDIQTPEWLKIFKFIATVAVGVTFFVVLLFLIPVYYYTTGTSPLFFYEDNCIILHLLGPLFAILTLCVFEKDDIIQNKKITYFAMLSTVLYGIVYFTCVVIFKVWPDFYGLTFEGRYYLSPIGALLIFAVCWGNIELIYFLQKLCIKKLPEKTYGKRG